jgi:hypothetical protein
MDSKHLLAAFGIASALLAAVPGTSFGAENPPAAKTEAQPGVVKVETDKYILTVRTPEGWQADTETAKKYRGDILFTRKTEAGGGAKVMVAVHRKFDENTSLLIQGEVNNIRKQFPDVQLADLDVKHPRYATFTKTFSQPGQFFQYEAFLNPGSMYANVVYVGMSTSKDPATPAELATYKEIVQSVELALPVTKPAPNPQ